MLLLTVKPWLTIFLERVFWTQQVCNKSQWYFREMMKMKRVLHLGAHLIHFRVLWIWQVWALKVRQDICKWMEEQKIQTRKIQLKNQWICLIIMGTKFFLRAKSLANLCKNRILLACQILIRLAKKMNSKYQSTQLLINKSPKFKSKETEGTIQV